MKIKNKDLKLNFLNNLNKKQNNLSNSLNDFSFIYQNSEIFESEIDDKNVTIKPINYFIYLIFIVNY